MPPYLVINIKKPKFTSNPTCGEDKKKSQLMNYLYDRIRDGKFQNCFHLIILNLIHLIDALIRLNFIII